MSTVENTLGTDAKAERFPAIDRSVVRIARLCRAHSVTVMQFNCLVFFAAQLGIAISLFYGAPSMYVQELSRIVFGYSD